MLANNFYSLNRYLSTLNKLRFSNSWDVFQNKPNESSCSKGKSLILNLEERVGLY